MISALAMWNGIYPLGNGPKLIYVDRPYHLPPYSNISDSTEQNFALPKGGNIMVVKLNSTLML